jgi:ABC transport system ATP-binding/permease protein
LPPIISAQGLSKKYGATPLFKDISFTISSGDCIGVVGPNGSGKSTLLEILAGRVKPDTGDVAVRKGTRLSCVTQISDFAAGDTVLSVVERALETAGVPQSERAGRIAETLGRVGFTDRGTAAVTLSGGWRKRLAIAEALVQQPDILLLDEPTNHLDLAGITWLEGLLRNAAFACVVVSHDRYFLENVATEIVELNKLYADGLLRVNGNYSTFLEAKELYLHAQRKEQAALANRVHTEIEWLRRGPKARTTKSKSRIDKAHEMIGELADLNNRTRNTAARIDFSATNRQTKQLITLDGISCELGGRSLFKDLNFAVTAGMRVGLVGPNGSGKTTLLRLLRGELSPTTGKIVRAEPLRLVYFDQSRQLDPDQTLRRALAPDSDAVIYQERVIHVAAWAARFLFDAEDLNQRVGKLSGGERARVLIAQLMLQPADVLLLDEPTNDLDIPTLEILEESLLEFSGALVLVTHDRYMLDRVSTIVLGLEGAGGAERFADYSQWEAWQRKRKVPASKVPAVKEKVAKEKVATVTVSTALNTAKNDSNGKPSNSNTSRAETRRKLSYQEQREFANIEETIAQAEELLAAKRIALADPELASDGPRLLDTCKQMEDAQHAVERLYARWAELAEKKE